MTLVPVTRQMSSGGTAVRPSAYRTFQGLVREGEVKHLAATPKQSVWREIVAVFAPKEAQSPFTFFLAFLQEHVLDLPQSQAWRERMPA